MNSLSIVRNYMETTQVGCPKPANDLSAPYPAWAIAVTGNTSFIDPDRYP